MQNMKMEFLIPQLSCLILFSYQNHTSGDSLCYSNDMKFSTLDQNNDSGNRVTNWKSAGWFKSSRFKTYPNG